MGVMDGLKQAAIALRAADKIPEYNAILDAQQKIFDLQNENQELKQSISELRKATDLEEKLSFDAENGVYRLKDDARAFCRICYERDGKLSTLRWNESREWTSAYHCNICGGSTHRGGYVQ
jgi:hypothetical protein